jgi:hypothetical protein
LPHSAKSLAVVFGSAPLGLSIVTASAFALTIVGTRGDDRIRGSNDADRTAGRASARALGGGAFNAPPPGTTAGCTSDWERCFSSSSS